jgi:hypothetical protein
MISHTKIKFLVITQSVDAGSVHEAIKQRYPLIRYCGFYKLRDETWLYVHHKHRLSGAQLSYILSALRPTVKIEEMYKYSKIEGVLLDESGTRMVHGGRRIGGAIVTGNTGHQGIATSKKKNVTVNPFGQESLGHITLEFMLDLAARPTMMDRVDDFAKKLYSVEENMNIRLRAKERYVKIRVEDGEWETNAKRREYDRIMKNILRQYRMVLSFYRDSIPEEGLERCERVLTAIELSMITTDSEYKSTYDVFLENTATVIGENIAEKVSLKKLKLV